MGVAHALQAFAHKVGNPIGMLGTNTGHSKFIGPDL